MDKVKRKKGRNGMRKVWIKGNGKIDTVKKKEPCKTKGIKEQRQTEEKRERQER